MSTPVGSSQWMYASGAEEGQSLRFEDGDSAYLSWTPASAGNRKTWTWSGWVKRGNLTSYQRIFQTTSTYSDSLILYNNDTLVFWGSDASTWNLQTSAVFRDPSAWYHIVISVDTTQATASDRMKIYVNNELQTLSTATYPSQNTDCLINNTQAHYIGTNSASNQYLDGYLANVAFIDGQALDPTSFGEYDDTLWRPKSDTDITSNLTFGTNGFYLPFKQTTEAEGFSTVTYVGTGNQPHSIEGVGFEPDFVWLKNRTDGSTSHTLFDSVRGAGKMLQSDSTSSEASNSQYGYLSSFDSSGFTLTNGSTNANYVNVSGKNYVAWCWDAGSGSAVSNTDGSITSSVKANTAKGFSIVSYTGGSSGTIGHGLGVAPSMIITKDRDSATQEWAVYHSSLSAGYSCFLNTTAAASNRPQDYTTTAPTSSVYSVGGGNPTSGLSDNYIAYCFAEVSGYSSIGSYSGTGASGNSITGLGFKPAWVMVKRYDGGTNGWMIYDNTRNPVDDRTLQLQANTSNAEATTSGMSFDSDGFTLKDGGNGTNGSGASYIYMAFADTRDATFFGDTSGNGNNWTPNALNNTDVVPDSPVTGGNFATLNPLDRVGVSLSQGNLKTTATAASFQAVRSTITYPSGSWYAEVRSDAGIGNGNSIVGITRVSDALSTMTGSNIVGTSSTAWSYASNGNIYNSNGVDTATGTTWSAGDIIGVAFDGSSVKFYKNNSLIHTESSLTGDYVLSLGQYSTDAMTANFGQDSSFAGNETPQGNTDDNGVGDFYYAPPSGFLCLKTSSLPAATITAPDEYFNTVLYTGTGATRSVTGVGFQPDWLWTKARSNASNHNLIDAVRGTNKLLLSDVSDAEYTQTIIDSFDSDGFTTSSAASGINLSGYTYVAWNWLAGNGTSSNTDGSITSTVSANQTAGFSVVGYTGNGTTDQTIGHGLGAAPDMIIVKRRSPSANWIIWHRAVTSGNGKYVFLDLTNALGGPAFTPVWDSTNTTTQSSTTTFDVGANVNVNNSGDDYIAYVFSEVESYSKIGSYTGNGSTDGTFVHCGFRPAWVMVKRTDGANNWLIQHNKSLGYNPSNSELYANLSNTEVTTDRADFLSNGFKARINSTENNGSGATYIFIAFAEAPFKSANAR